MFLGILGMFTVHVPTAEANCLVYNYPIPKRMLQAILAKYISVNQTQASMLLSATEVNQYHLVE